MAADVLQPPVLVQKLCEALVMLCCGGQVVPGCVEAGHLVGCRPRHQFFPGQE